MANFQTFEDFLKPHYLLQRRRDSLFDIEEGTLLEQISDETGTPLRILEPLNLNFYPPTASLTRDYSPASTSKAASRVQSKPARGPRMESVYRVSCYADRCEEIVTWVPQTELPKPPSPRRSPRRATHYVREGYACRCPHVHSGSTAHAMSSVENVESPLFVAEDEPAKVIWKKQSRPGRWSPYPTSC